MPDSDDSRTDTAGDGLGRLDGVEVEVAIRAGSVRLPIDTLVNWTEGSLLELNVPPDQTVDVLVDGEPFAKGKVVTIGEAYGVRILELLNDGPDAA